MCLWSDLYTPRPQYSAVELCSVVSKLQKQNRIERICCGLRDAHTSIQHFTKYFMQKARFNNYLVSQFYFYTLNFLTWFMLDFANPLAYILIQILIGIIISLKLRIYRNWWFYQNFNYVWLNDFIKKFNNVHSHFVDSLEKKRPSKLFIYT